MNYEEMHEKVVKESEVYIKGIKSGDKEVLSEITHDQEFIHTIGEGLLFERISPFGAESFSELRKCAVEILDEDTLVDALSGSESSMVSYDKSPYAPIIHPYFHAYRACCAAVAAKFFRDFSRSRDAVSFAKDLMVTAQDSYEAAMKSTKREEADRKKFRFFQTER